MNCLAVAFANVLNVPVDDIFDFCGHDGSEVIFPALDKPYCYRGFHIQEMVDFCESRDFTVTPIDYKCVLSSKGCLYDTKVPNTRFVNYLSKYYGVLVGITYEGGRHAVAWKNCIIDTDGKKYTYPYFKEIHQFWAVR